MSKIHPAQPFPRTIKIRDVNYIFDYFDMKNLEEAANLFAAASQMGEGFSKHETEKQHVHDLITTGGKVNAMQAIEESSGNFVAVLLSEPSHLVRSEKPMCIGGRSVINPKYRGRGILRYLNDLWIVEARTHGYLGKPRIH